MSSPRDVDVPANGHLGKWIEQDHTHFPRSGRFLTVAALILDGLINHRAPILFPAKVAPRFNRWELVEAI
jgi:hypothetical protein